MKKLAPSLLALSLTAAFAGGALAQSSTDYGSAPAQPAPSWDSPSAPQSRSDVKEGARQAAKTNDAPTGNAQETMQQRYGSPGMAGAHSSAYTEPPQYSNAPAENLPVTREQVKREIRSSGVLDQVRGDSRDVDLVGPTRAN